MKSYFGRAGAANAFVGHDGIVMYELNPRLDLRNHSPTGFAVGYAGSGPAQLALAILADAIGDERALNCYQQFKIKAILPMQREGAWSISEDEVKRHIAEIEREAS